MAYRAGYFECKCLEDFKFFETVEQLLAKMSAWEVRNHQATRLNRYGYGFMFNISKAKRHANVWSSFNLLGLNFDNNFASEPSPWSSIQSIIVGAKHSKNPIDDWFPIARDDPIVALIASDYGRLGWCQTPSKLEWTALIGPGSRDRLNLIIKGSSAHGLALQPIDQPYAAEDLF